MQSLISTTTSNLLSSACARQPSWCALQLNFVRWRKPRWIPVGKKNRYYVSKRGFTQEPDRSERRSLNNSYGTHLKSIWAYQRGLHYGRLEEAQSAASQRSFDEELEKIMEENDKINAEIAAKREKARAEQWKLWEEEILSTRLQKELEEEENLKLTEQQILAQVERLKTAIKIEDLDKAIEDALNTEVDYNYALDKNGNIYPGRHNNNVAQNPDSPETQSQSGTQRIASTS